MKRLFSMATAFILAVGTLFATNARADLFSGQYGQSQVFDVARSGCTTVGGSCSVYNFIDPFIAPYTNWTKVTWAAGDYVKFVDTGSTISVSGTALPNLQLIQYDSSGNQKQVISSSGYAQAIGTGIVYIGVPATGGGTGYFISNTVGIDPALYRSNSNFSLPMYSPTITAINPNLSTLQSYGTSSTPLSAGQTFTPPATPNWTAVTNSIITSVTPTSNNSPAGETANKALDGTSSSKYLNFDRANAGFTIELNQGRVINAVKFTTANDFEPRDPTKFTLYGSNDGKTWTEITANQSTTLTTVSGRYTQTSLISINNTNPYVYYFITFPSIKAIDTYGSVAGCQAALGTLACDSVQIGEVTYYYDSNNTATSSSTLVGSIANPGTPGATSSMNTGPTVVSTAPGTSQVSVTESPGTTLTSTSSSRGTTVDVTTYSNARGDRTQDGKQLAVIRTTTVTSTTPITTTVTQTTPVTVTTVTTPRTVTTWSDGTTTTADDTPTTTVTQRNDVVVTASTVDEVVVNATAKNYYTRVDQMSQLASANQRTNMNLDSDLLNRHTSTGGGLTSRTTNAGSQERGWWWLSAEGSRTSTPDTYALKGSRIGVGHERQIKGNWIVGAQYNRIEDKMTGQDAGGTMIKDHVGLYSLYNHNNWLLKTDLGMANNSFTNYHSLPELGYANSGQTKGRDYWLSNRLYTPDWRGFRPFAGLRLEQNNRGAMTESGDAITAMSFDRVKDQRTVSELGLRYDVVVKGLVNLMTEAGHTDSGITTVRTGLSFTPRQNVMGGVTVGQQRHNGITQNTAQAKLVLLF